MPALRPQAARTGADEMVIGSPFWRAPEGTPGGEAASFMYLAAANMDPLAPSAALTAGIRVGAINISAYQIMRVPDGISLADNQQMWEFTRLALKDFHSEARVAGVDPLVLDLDGDGIELTPGGYGPLFDLDGDFFLEPSVWVRPAAAAGIAAYGRSKAFHYRGNVKQISASSAEFAPMFQAKATQRSRIGPQFVGPASSIT